MDALSYTLDKIKFSIPRPVLNNTFFDQLRDWHRSPESLDSKMLNKVIRPRVLVDIDICGGEELMVPLDNLSSLYQDDYCIVFEIPPAKIKNRRILSTLSVSYLPYSSSGSSDIYGMTTGMFTPLNDTVGAGLRVGLSVSNAPSAATASVELVGENTIMIKDRIRIVHPFMLRCRVGNEENLSNLSTRYYKHFADLTILAIKSYIYNNQFITIDEAKLSGGQELGTFKSIVESYSDAEEMYNTYLHEKWRKISIMNDPNAHTRFIKAQIAANL